MSVYRELVTMVIKRKWSSKIIIETGVMPHAIVNEGLSELPITINYQVIRENYSITTIKPIYEN